MLISNESQEVQSEAIYMLLSNRKLLLILTPPLTLLLTLALVYLVDHNQQHRQRAQPSRQSNTSASLTHKQQVVASPRISKLARNSISQSQPTAHLISETSETKTTTATATKPFINSTGELLNSRRRLVERHQPQTISPSQEQQTNPNRMSSSEQESIKTLTSQATSDSLARELVDERKATRTLSDQRAENDRLNETTIDILLDCANFVLHSRCSGNKVALKINKRTKKPLISARNRVSKQETTVKRQQRDSDKIKLLSMIFTVESVAQTNSINQTNEGAIEGQQQQVNETRGAQEASKEATNTTNFVRLRANLTELYICFNERGKLEARVSIN